MHLVVAPEALTHLAEETLRVILFPRNRVVFFLQRGRKKKANPIPGKNGILDGGDYDTDLLDTK